MRINEIRITNFKGFREHSETFDPNFTVFVGENGAGKTSMLEAVALSLVDWSYAVGEQIEINPGIVRIASETNKTSIAFREVIPLVVAVTGDIGGNPASWTIKFNGTVPITNLPFFSSTVLTEEGSRLRKEFDSGENASANWPVIAFYTADRGRSEKPKLDWNRVFADKPKRVDGYKGWKNSADLIAGFSGWLGRQEAIAFQESIEPAISGTVKAAIISCLPHAKDLRFSAKEGEPIIVWDDDSSVTFGNLSHGQKSILAMVGDIARRCAMVNPHLETDAPAKTPGIVLIDELDLHLHPRWQRRIVDDLKRTFPEIQFITTTHSPFIIQALQPGELRILGGEEPRIEYSNRGIEEIARFIQGIDMPQESERFTRQKEAAKQYFQLLRDGRNEDDPELQSAKSKLDKVMVSYADNPGLEAIIESQEASSPALVREE